MDATEAATAWEYVILYIVRVKVCNYVYNSVCNNFCNSVYNSLCNSVYTCSSVQSNLY